jgi:glycosyltransferase involved in cell wall biosynthesis
MRICHIITRLIIGGAQENTILTCEGLTRLGHDVILMAGPETGREGSLWPRAEQSEYALERITSMRRGVNPWHDWRCRRELTRRLRDLRPDIVHTHSSKAGVLGRLAARDAGVPMIFHTIHGMSFNRTQPAPVYMLYRALERYCASFTDRILCVADAMTDQAVAAGIAPREKFATVYSGMETEAYRPELYDRAAVRAEWNVEPDHVVVGTVARLFRNKGYEQLIAATRIAAAGNASLRFVWVGDGDQRPEYESMLRDAGLTDRVILTGLVPPTDVPRLLSGMDLLVHSSQWEGLPRVLVQALLMQVPVISFDNDGAPEVVIPGETGALAPFNDITALAEAITTLAENAEQRTQYGHTGREQCLKRFDHTRMSEQIEAEYLSERPERV